MFYKSLITKPRQSSVLLSNLKLTLNEINFWAPNAGLCSWAFKIYIIRIHSQRFFSSLKRQNVKIVY